MFLTSLLHNFFHCPCPCSHIKTLINDSNIPTDYVGVNRTPLRNTWYNWHNIILRIWTLCSRDLFQQVAVIQFMQDIPFPFRFYGGQWWTMVSPWKPVHTTTPWHPTKYFSPPSSYSVLTPYIHCTKTLLTTRLHDSTPQTTTVLYTSNYVLGHTCTAKHYKLIWMTEQQQALYQTWFSFGLWSPG